MRPFEFGCSTRPFDALPYCILSRCGCHLGDLILGTVTPRSRTERYFLRCVREGADYDSHQCSDADAWAQLTERRTFEEDHPAPHPNRTWIREWELRAGMILFFADRSPVLLAKAQREVKLDNVEMRYRNRTDLPWHAGALHDEGWWRLVTALESGEQDEIFVNKAELLEVSDGADRVMRLLWWNGPHDDDMLLEDPDTGEVFFIARQRVSGDFTSAPLNNKAQVRVQWWNDKPLWVWGPA